MNPPLGTPPSGVREGSSGGAGSASLAESERQLQLSAMFRRLAALLAPPKASPKRLVDLELEVADLDARLDFLEAEVKSLRGRVTGAERRKKEDPVPEEPKEQPNGFPPAPLLRTVRRLRGF